MDIKCKNCGQMVNQKDKYCRYCGCPVPKEPEKPKLTQKQAEDNIQLAKTVIVREDIDGANEWDIKNLITKHKGIVSNVITKTTLLFLLYLLLAGVCFGVAIFLTYFKDIGGLTKFFCIILPILACLTFMAFALEAYFNLKAYKALESGKIIIRRYGLRKPAEFLLENHIFELDINKPCPTCEGEIIGDLHIERIEDIPVVVCNYNRKHIWSIDESSFFASLSGKGDSVSINTDTASAKEAKVDAVEENTPSTDKE